MPVVLRLFIADSPVSAYCLDILSGCENWQNRCYSYKTIQVKSWGELNSGISCVQSHLKRDFLKFSSQMNFTSIICNGINNINDIILSLTS